jgi:MFS-type transporter involved in bile tolerance (Atg22 family)
MSNEKKSWLQRNWKDLMLTITVTFVVFYVAVFSGVWADRNYKTDFWPNFFMWTGIILGIAIVVGWVVGWVKQDKKPKG